MWSLNWYFQHSGSSFTLTWICSCSNGGKNVLKLPIFDVVDQHCSYSPAKSGVVWKARQFKKVLWSLTDSAKTPSFIKMLSSVGKKLWIRFPWTHAKVWPPNCWRWTNQIQNRYCSKSCTDVSSTKRLSPRKTRPFDIIHCGPLIPWSYMPTRRFERVDSSFSLLFILKEQDPFYWTMSPSAIYVTNSSVI